MWNSVLRPDIHPEYITDLAAIRHQIWRSQRTNGGEVIPSDMTWMKEVAEKYGWEKKTKYVYCIYVSYEVFGQFTEAIN